MAEEPNAASVAIIEGGRVLLIQRARQPYAGLWTLPGGRLEAGETAEQCAIREVREELGIAVRGLVLVSTGSVREIVGGNWHIAVFAAAAFSGEIVPSDEIAGYRWTSPADAATIRTTPGLDVTLDLAFRVVQQAQ